MSIEEVIIQCQEVSEAHNNKQVIIYCSWFWLEEVHVNLTGKSEIIKSIELDETLDEDTILYIKVVEDV